MLHGIFDGAEYMLVDDIAGVTDDEKVAEFLVEDDFGCHAAVGAAQYHGEGMLACAELFSQFRIIVFRCQGSRDEAGVAGFEGL